MLTYFNQGLRTRPAWPIPVYARRDWEFQAVVRGKAIPTVDGATQSLPHERSLWVFPPRFRHGWSCPDARGCQIVVFHLQTQHVHPLLLEACKDSYLRVGLTAVEVQRLKELARGTTDHYPRASALTPFWVDRLAADLCWMVARKLEAQPELPTTQSNAQRVHRATSWFSEHMSQGIGVAEAAAAVGVTAGHLRKLFKQVGLDPPQKVFAELRIERAKTLLIQSDLALQDIAKAVGSSGSTALCRQFLAQTRQSPRSWAKQQRASSGH
ncbi:MAG: AraC family transcriptional regulator [Planctomycetota bacterium]